VADVDASAVAEFKAGQLTYWTAPQAT